MTNGKLQQNKFVHLQRGFVRGRKVRLLLKSISGIFEHFRYLLYKFHAGSYSLFCVFVMEAYCSVNVTTLGKCKNRVAFQTIVWYCN